MGQVVFIVGEPGIGKSRLLYEFRRRVGDRATWLEGHCLSFGQRHRLPSADRSPAGAAFSIEEGDHESGDRPRRSTRRRCASAGTCGPSSPYLRSLLSVDPGDAAVSSHGSPAPPRRRSSTALRRLHRPRRRASGPRSSSSKTSTGSTRPPRSSWRHDGQRARPGGCSSCSPTGPATRHPFGERSYHYPHRARAPSRPRTARGWPRASSPPDGLPEELVDDLGAQGRRQPVLRRGSGEVAEESRAPFRLSGSGYVLARRLDERRRPRYDPGRDHGPHRPAGRGPEEDAPARLGDRPRVHAAPARPPRGDPGAH